MQPNESDVTERIGSPQAEEPQQLPPAGLSTPAVMTQGPSQKFAKPLAIAIIGIGLVLLMGGMMALLNLSQ